MTIRAERAGKEPEGDSGLFGQPRAQLTRWLPDEQEYTPVGRAALGSVEDVQLHVPTENVDGPVWKLCDAAT